jgi:hypothetical protein
MSYVVPPEYQKYQDDEQLRLLSILHFVMAGLSALGLCAGPFYMMMGATLASGSKDGPGTMAFFVMMGAVVTFISLVATGLTAYAGYCIRERKNWMFVFVVDCLLCLNAPLGTLLGVFTIIVLLRPTVKEAFGEKVVYPPGLVQAAKPVSEEPVSVEPTKSE